MKRLALSLRLFIAAILSTVLAIAATGTMIAYLFKVYFEDRVRSELAAHLVQLTGNLSIGADGRLSVLPMSDQRFGQPFSGLYWQVETEGSGVLLSRSLWDQAISVEIPARAGEIESDQITHSTGLQFMTVSWRIMIGGEGQPRSVLLTVASDLAEVTLAAKRFRDVIAVWLGILATGLIIAAWLQVRIGLRPLETIRAQIEKIKTSPEMRLPTDLPAEVLPLVDEVNSLLDDQQTSLQKARQRAGDLAHGLKTPLTVMGALSRDTRSAGQDAIADQIDEQITSMRNFVERELARTRSSYAVGPDCDLEKVANRMVGTVRRLPHGADIDWRVNIAPGIRAPFDEHDLSELLGNILDNARKFAASTVKIDATTENGTTVLCITDDGPGVPEARLDSILERGARAENGMQGQGLGLAIVRDLVEGHGCTLDIRNIEDGGLCLEISWPQIHSS